MKHPLFTFALFSYLITWSIILTFYFLFKTEFIDGDTLNLLSSLGAVGPFLAAVLTSKIFYGYDGVKKLYSSLRVKGINIVVLIICISPLVFFLIAFFIYPFWKGNFLSFEAVKSQFQLNTTLSYFGWIVPFLVYAIFEEIGWRGFALPHLQEKYTALKSTVFLTIIWAGWHLPFFLYRLNFSLMISFGFFIGLFIGAIILTSIYNLSSGSVIAVILFHLTNNIASAFDKEIIAAVLSAGFFFVAIFLINYYKKENLADKMRIKNYFIQK